MPVRPVDEPIPRDEWLYRAVGTGDVRGDTVLHHSIDLRPGCSFARAKYLGDDPRKVLEHVKGGKTGIAAVQPLALPGRLEAPPEGRAFRFEVADVPLDDDDAHCEVRLIADPGAYNKNLRVRSSVQLVFLQEKLARTLRVIMAP